ncbi:MAG: hypothetical protein Q9167_005199 [Letrouitia subvulpina]
MAFLFRNRSSKTDLAKPTKELLSRLWQSPPPPQKTEDELVRLLSQMKLILQGTQETETSPEQVSQLVNSIIQEDLLYLLARSIHLLPFESRKDSQSVFSYALRFKPPNGSTSDPPALVHVINHRPEIIIELCRGYAHKESAMPSGVVLREALKAHEAIAEIILYDQCDDQHRSSEESVFWNFFPWIDGGAFEVSTDAFTTFREILTRHKPLVSHFLEANFSLFFKKYNTTLIQSNSYVTKRQSIKLLGEILLDRNNYAVMTRYVDDGDNLKVCMTLLKDDRKMVQYEGFHVFKVFVANPNKSASVQRILVNNRERLLRFLPGFLEDRTEDEQFLDEKSFLIRQIESMASSPS